MKDLFHRMFSIGVWMKGIIGALEVIGGGFGFWGKKKIVINLFQFIFQKKII